MKPLPWALPAGFPDTLDQLAATAGRVMLLGTDAEGDARESWCGCLSSALLQAALFTAPQSDGPGWQAWRIWWNNPLKGGAWEIFAESPGCT